MAEGTRLAVLTKTLPATGARGTRITVSHGSQRATYPWDYALDTGENHRSAAVDFAREKLGLNTVVIDTTSRTTASGYLVTLSTYTTEEAPHGR